MKISMHLRQTLTLPVQAPAPPVTGLFDPAQEIRRDEFVAVWVTVGQPHNALAVADQLPEPTPIESRIAPLSGMDLRQVARQGYRPFSILFPERSAFGQSFQVKMITPPLRPLGKDKEFLCRSDGHEFLIRRKGADVERLHMARQPAIGVIIPKYCLGPVRWMLMTERPRLHGFKHGRLYAAANTEGHLDRRPISVPFLRPLRTGLADHLVGQQCDIGTEASPEILFKRIL